MISINLKRFVDGYMTVRSRLVPNTTDDYAPDNRREIWKRLVALIAPSLP